MLHKAREEGASSAATHGVQLDVDTGEVAELWRRGSVVGSWLLDLAASSLHKDPALTDFDGDVADSGEGRWTVKTAVDLGVPAHVLSTALFNRFSSRGEATYANKVLSALRYAFGGHVEKS
jgi:6-phosphogluconate dehydrogenase